MPPPCPPTRGTVKNERLAFIKLLSGVDMRRRTSMLRFVQIIIYQLHLTDSNHHQNSFRHFVSHILRLISHLGGWHDLLSSGRPYPDHGKPRGPGFSQFHVSHFHISPFGKYCISGPGYICSSRISIFLIFIFPTFDLCRIVFLLWAISLFCSVSTFSITDCESLLLLIL